MRFSKDSYEMTCSLLSRKFSITLSNIFFGLLHPSSLKLRINGINSINGFIPISPRNERTASKYITSVSDPSYIRKYCFLTSSDFNTFVLSANVLFSRIHYPLSLTGNTVLNIGTPPYLPSK